MVSIVELDLQILIEAWRTELFRKDEKAGTKYFHVPMLSIEKLVI